MVKERTLGGGRESGARPSLPKERAGNSRERADELTKVGLSDELLEQRAAEASGNGWEKNRQG